MQAYLEIYTSRVRINEQIVFRSTEGDNLALCLSNSIDNEQITNIVDSKRRFVFATTKIRLLTLLFAKSEELQRISFNFDMQAYIEI